MSDLVPARTVRQAKAREKRILDGVAEIQPFIQDRDWELLGYQSFVEWSDARLFPMLDALDATVKRELQPELHRALREPDPVTKRQLTPHEIAGRTGASERTVQYHLQDPVPAKLRKDDLDGAVLDAEIVDETRPVDLEAASAAFKARQEPANPAEEGENPFADWGPNESALHNMETVLTYIEHLSTVLFDRDDPEAITDDTKRRLRTDLVKAKNMLGEIKKGLV